MAGVWRMKARFTARQALAACLFLLTAGCAAIPKAPPPAPAARPPANMTVLPPRTVPAMPEQPWDELPVIEGGWAYDAVARRARFVDDTGVERASLTCTAPLRSVQLALPGDTAAAVEILTSSVARQTALRSGEADIGAADAMLDAIAFSRGRFALRASQLLVLPVQSELGRLIEDCRG